jgi:hypothetical protein
MNLREWQLSSGAYMPDWNDRIEIALENLKPDYMGRLPAWAWAYWIGYASVKGARG